MPHCQIVIRTCWGLTRLPPLVADHGDGRWLNWMDIEQTAAWLPLGQENRAAVLTPSIKDKGKTLQMPSPAWSLWFLTKKTQALDYKNILRSHRNGHPPVSLAFLLTQIYFSCMGQVLGSVCLWALEKVTKLSALFAQYEPRPLVLWPPHFLGRAFCLPHPCFNVLCMTFNSLLCFPLKAQTKQQSSQYLKKHLLKIAGRWWNL